MARTRGQAVTLAKLARYAFMASVIFSLVLCAALATAAAVDWITGPHVATCTTR